MGIGCVIMNLNLTDCSSIKDQIKELWQYSFSDPDDFMSLYFGKFWNGRNAVAALDGKDLLGALELVPYKISLRGTWVDASYIVGVSTAPEARGRGVATKLMRGAIEKQGKRREVLSLLYPFSYSFYNRMGYAPCYQQARCEIPFERMPATHYSGRFFRPSLNDFTALSNVYENFCKGKNGFVQRTKKEWKFIFEMLNLENGHLYAYKNGGIQQLSNLYEDGKISEEEAMKLLSECVLHYRHPALKHMVITLWSAVYNCNEKSMLLSAGMDYSKQYKFYVDKPCEVITVK